MEANEYLRALIRDLPRVVALAILAGLLAFGATLVIPRTFEAEATLLVGPPLDEMTLDFDQVRASESLVGTLVEAATTTPVLANALEDSELTGTVSDLAGHVSARAGSAGNLMVVAGRGASSNDAEEVANAVAHALVTATAPSQGGPGSALIEIAGEQVVELQVAFDRLAQEVDRLSSLSVRSADQDQALLGARDSLLQTSIALIDATSLQASLISEPRLNILEAAAAWEATSSPPVITTIAAGAIIGFVLGAVAILIDQAYRRPSGSRQILDRSGVGCLSRPASRRTKHQSMRSP